MPNLNKVMLMGNLTRDPELRYTPNNTPVVNIGLAINRTWTNRESGEKQEETTFVSCAAFGRTAEVMNQYLRKGRPVFVDGRLRFDQWQDKDGNNRSKLEVVIENFQFIDSRGGGETEGDAGPGSRSQPASPGRAPAESGGPSGATPNPDPSGAGPGGAHVPVEEDDIPF